MPSRWKLTRFRFICRHCGRQNAHEERHRAAVRPHLVSTRCQTCGRINFLGGISGTIVDAAQEEQEEQDQGTPRLPLDVECHQTA